MLKVTRFAFTAVLAAASAFSMSAFADDGGKLTQRANNAGPFLSNQQMLLTKIFQ